MGLFFNNLRKEARVDKPRPRSARGGGHIPIEALGKLGCSVCPRDGRRLTTPKMAPSGAEHPLLYLLGNNPTHEEDESGVNWSGIAARAVMSKIPRGFAGRHVRVGNIVQCAPEGAEEERAPGPHEQECCRPRVVSDIERSRPAVVVGMGDEALHWATGLPRSALTFRGTPIAARFGSHECWYVPIIYPNYTKGKARQRVSEYELAVGHDVLAAVALAESGRAAPTTHRAPYDTGIACITGREQGDMARLEGALHSLVSSGLPHGFDIETNGLRPYQLTDPRIWTAAVGTFGGVVAFSVEHEDGWGTETRIRRVRGMLGDYIAQSGRKRCHNVAFEQEWSAYFYGNGILRRTEWEDTMAMAHALDERKGTKSLDVQVRARFGFFLKAQSRVDVSLPDWARRFKLEEILRYNGLDSKWTDRLADELLSDLCGDPRAMALYGRFERTAPTLVLMSARGLPADLGYARGITADMDARIAAVEERGSRTPELREYARRVGRFEWTNPDHALALMRDICGRDEVARDQRDGTVKWTSDEEALESIPRSEVPSAALIVEHRGLTRNKTTYLGPLLEGKMTGPDGMLHWDYSQLHTITGRLNSTAHNWPKHKHREVRGVVFAPPGHWIVAADYGQIEFRVAGMLSGDDNIIKYSWTGYDVHGYWAQRIVDEYPRVKDRIVAEYEIDWDEKGLKTLRQEAKNGWVFPQLFGSTTESCAGRMGIPDDVASVLGREFWDEFKGARRWQLRTIAGYEKNLYVETLGGFRRRGPTTVNELVNMPIQGTAFEIVAAGMNAISERSELEGDESLHPAFNGHDDLSFVLPDDGLEARIAIIAEEMCRPRFDYVNVPLIVEVSVGPRWHRLEEVARYSSEVLFNLRNPYK